MRCVWIKLQHLSGNGVGHWRAEKKKNNCNCSLPDNFHKGKLERLGRKDKGSANVRVTFQQITFPLTILGTFLWGGNCFCGSLLHLHALCCCLPACGYLIVCEYFNRKTQCMAKPGQGRFMQLLLIIYRKSLWKCFLAFPSSKWLKCMSFLPPFIQNIYGYVYLLMTFLRSRHKTYFHSPSHLQ